MNHLGLRVIVVVAVLIGATSMLGAGALMAQTNLSGGIVEEIRVEGTQRIEPETVRSYLKVNPGDAFDAGALNEALNLAASVIETWRAPMPRLYRVILTNRTVLRRPDFAARRNVSGCLPTLRAATPRVKTGARSRGCRAM